METQSRFDLNAALENWRRSMSAQRNLLPEARRELEAHLRDLFDELRGRGVAEAEAFSLARQRVGEPQLLDREFKIAMNATWFHRNRPAAIAAWIVFVISFGLPAFDDWLGWKCAILHPLFWSSALQGQWTSIHYLLLTLANLLMLASPFLLARAGQDARVLKWLRGLSASAFVLVWSYLIELFVLGSRSDMRIGCYLWGASFGLLLAASLLQTVPGKVVRQNA
jgi:hypothetical protein